MKKSPGLLALAAGMMLAACTTEPQEGDVTHVTNIYQDTVGIVPSDSLQYHEIRIDVFSHYWQSQKLWRTSLGGGRLLFVDSSYDEGVVRFDTLILGDPSLDKTASLPAFVVDSSDHYDGYRLVYTALHAPKTFSCYYYNGGKMLVEQDSSESGDFVVRRANRYEFEGEEPQFDGYRLGTAPFTTYMEPVPCGYLVGKGFYLSNSFHDDWGAYPQVPGSEIVIRY